MKKYMHIYITMLYHEMNTKYQNDNYGHTRTGGYEKIAG